MNYKLKEAFFTKNEPAEILEEKYNNRFKTKIVENSYLDMLGEYRDMMTQSFFETKMINDEIKYRITRGIFRSIAEKVVNVSPLLKMVKCIENSKYTIYDAVSSSNYQQRDNRYDAINLALLFGLISFEIIGGNRPEIFIRINFPQKIR